LTQFGSAFFAFACVWLISKKIGSEGYGGVVAIIAASQVAQILVNWTAVSVVRFGTEEFIETEKIARAFWLRFFVLVPNIVLALLASRLWFPPLAGWLKLPAESFWFVILHFAATAVWIHVQFGLQGAKLPREQGFLLMFERFLTLAGILILLGIDKLSPLSALICYSISPILMMSVGVFYLRRFIFARFSVDLPYLKKILAYSLPLLPFSLVGYFSGSYVDAIFVSNFLSTKDLGIYSVATQINGIALQLPTLANSLLIPFFVTLEKENLTAKLNGYFEDALPSLTLIGGGICTFAGLVGYFFIPLVFGNEFSASVMPFWILLSSSVVAIPLLCGYSALTHSNSVTYFAAITSIVSASINIFLNYLLIPKFGMEGCAWATFFAYFSSTASLAFLLRAKVEMPVSWVFLAMLPILSGSICYFYTGNMWVGFMTSSILSLFIILLKRRSVFMSFDILRRFVRN
jgi:O-antigen/teichoic acid export membrane protein